jgi:hypothetical protein
MPLLRFFKPTFVLRPALNNLSADAGYCRGAEATNTPGNLATRLLKEMPE